MYALHITEKCEEEIKKLTSRNKTLADALKKKIKQILEKPEHFKPLGNVLAGLRRVHVDSSFVLIYDFDANAKSVRLIRFAHHDEAYK